MLDAHLIWRSSRPLLLQFPTPCFPITPSQAVLSEPTLALKSPRMMSLLTCQWQLFSYTVTHTVHDLWWLFLLLFHSVCVCVALCWESTQPQTNPGDQIQTWHMANATPKSHLSKETKPYNQWMWFTRQYYLGFQCRGWSKVMTRVTLWYLVSAQTNFRVEQIQLRSLGLMSIISIN